MPPPENGGDTEANLCQSKANLPERHEKAPEIYRLFPTPSSSHFGVWEKNLTCRFVEICGPALWFACKAVVFFVEIR